MSDAQVSVTAPPVSAIADVLALWGRDGWLTPPLRPVVPSTRSILSGVRIVEVRATPGGAGIGPIYDLLSSPLAGHVVLIAGAQPVPGAMWGEILSTAAAQYGAAGVLVDGAVRDRPAMSAIGLPIYAASEAVVGPAGQVEVIGTDRAVIVGGATVSPDDLVVIDETGCVRVCAAELDEVMEAAERYAAAEELVVQALDAGTPLTEAYRHKQTVVAELRR